MLRNIAGTIGAWIIYALIWHFGRRYTPSQVPWLVGPLGGKSIGDRPYEETAAAEGLTLVREASEGGLIPRFEVLRSRTFDPDRVDPKIRDFYVSAGRGFGDAGFYRTQRSGHDRLRIWRVQTLHERFELFVDAQQTLRCEHAVRFLRMPVLKLHYRIREEG